MKKHIPTRDQWQTVLDKLYSVLPFAMQEERSLDMGETRVNSRHACGTVHCVGGWYAIGHHKESAFSGTSGFLCYAYGADRMANDLGFQDRTYLSQWARENEELWGNEYGTELFYSLDAYGSARDLAGVIRHLEKVADNCLKTKS